MENGEVRILNFQTSCRRHSYLDEPVFELRFTSRDKMGIFGKSQSLFLLHPPFIYRGTVEEEAAMNSIASSVPSSLFLNPFSTTLSCSSLRSSSTIIRRNSIGESVNGRRGLKALVANSSTQKQGIEVEMEGAERGSLPSLESASDVVRRFYGGINGRDIASVESLIGENCVYEDLVFPKPFVGRKAILEFFEQFTNSISKDLQFVIDDISDDDSLAIGVTWHLE